MYKNKTIYAYLFVTLEFNLSLFACLIEKLKQKNLK